MWWGILVVAALTGGLIDFCMGQIELPEGAYEPPAGVNELTSSVDVWDTERKEFDANPAPATETAALVNIYGGVGATLGGPPLKWETVNFEFEAGSPEGWVEYVDAAISCETGEEVSLSGEAVLLVHFDGAYRGDGFIHNSVRGDSVILDAREVCDRDGVLEWAIAVESVASFQVDSFPYSELGYEYSVVGVDVLREP